MQGLQLPIRGHATAPVPAVPFSVFLLHYSPIVGFKRCGVPDRFVLKEESANKGTY